MPRPAVNPLPARPKNHFRHCEPQTTFTTCRTSVQSTCVTL